MVGCYHHDLDDDEDDNLDDYEDDDEDDEGYTAYSHQSYSHQVGICRNDKGWEYDSVNFPPYLCIMIMISIMMRGWGVWSD